MPRGDQVLKETVQQEKVSLKKLFLAMSNRIFRKMLRFIKRLLTCLVIIFSPVIIWVILSLNRELIVIIANSQWLSGIFPSLFATLGEHVNKPEFARGFNDAALGGLLTLFGVIVTVWYYQVIRIQEVTEKRLFVIDELLEELKKNRHIVNDLLQGKTEKYKSGSKNKKGSIFTTEAWHKMGADVALLPRRLHLRLSVLYAGLNRCSSADGYWKNQATIDRIDGIISDLHRYRSTLCKSDIA
ncbi:hypothetical protein SAMN05660706_11217 [Desulfoscipio geothermicus DSM 3669]|uniref:Uncharacterized protein n=1 Tax=Desulfoscipio geothermicus DSM 3669 TaxID=1121426 RepID=A0A1I6DIZ4_9FIRM|nr:hypothetical protein SAMN05660706_11217 [Desulfoscipio geothermicus DSM 3669]